MYLCETMDTILGIVRECVDILKQDGITNIGKIVFKPILNPDGTPKDWIGAMIFEDMCELHRYKFGLFTKDVIERFRDLVLDELKRNIDNIEPYRVNNILSISHNVLGLLETIIRLLVQYDTRYYLK